MEEEENFEGSGNKTVLMAETEALSFALLANATLLADEPLSCVAMKLSPLNQATYKDDAHRRPLDNRQPDQGEWKRWLVSSIDRLEDTFCCQHTLDLIFTEEGDRHLAADMCMTMDKNVEEFEWSSSLIFHDLFAKLNRMATIAADMFVGRERFATLALMRVMETVISCLLEDQSFWSDNLEGPKPFGPLGLQQFHLDMKFVICFTSQGHYLSQKLHHVVNGIISKAIVAFAANGVDPKSVLLKDDWFNDIYPDANERLSGKPKAINQDLNSPTASVSGQSISYVRSHGSS